MASGSTPHCQSQQQRSVVWRRAHTRHMRIAMLGVLCSARVPVGAVARACDLACSQGALRCVRSRVLFGRKV